MKRPFLRNRGGGKKLIIPAILISAGFLIAGIIFAYDSHNAHRALTYEAAEFYNLSTPSDSPSKEGERITPEEIGWMMDGAEEEDVPPRWINHFYNPATGEGWTGAGATDIPSDTLRLISKLALSSREPVSAKNWAKNRSAQSDYAYYGGDQTWQKAIEAYIAGNKKAAFEALGHILHLLEDMTVPDHTRNDTHAGLAGDKGSPYEDWAKNYTAGKEKNLQIAETLAKAGQKPKQFPIIENYFDANANYSSKNFFSADTIFDSTKDNPTIFQEKSGDFYTIAYANKAGDIYPIFEYPKDNKNFAKFTIDDPLILSAYWQRLSRQAVISGAGAINLFFQDVEQQKKLNPNPEPRQITSNSKIFSPFGALAQAYKAVNNFVLGAKTIATSILPAPATAIDINELTPPAPPVSVLDPGSVSGMTEGENSVQPKKNPSLASLFQREEPVLPPTQNNPSPLRQGYAGQAQPPLTLRGGGDEEKLYVSRVIDGDTVTLNNGRDVRLIGVNSPEYGEKCFEKAKQNLENLILGKYITLQKDTGETDKYNRLLRYIYLDGALINAEMVKNGFARVMTVPPDTKYKDAFRALEDEAKFFHYGCLWGEIAASQTPRNDSGVNKAADDKGPYYGGSSYAGNPERPGHQNTAVKISASYNETIFTPENSTSTPPEIPPIITPTSTPLHQDYAGQAPDAATSTPPALPEPEPATSTPQNKILINEIQIAGDSARDDFVELYNPNDNPEDITDWKLAKKTKSGNESNLVSKFSASTTIPARSYFLIVPRVDGAATATPADATFTGASYSVAADNTVILKNQNGQIIDKVGFGEAIDFESQPTLNPPKNQSLTRLNFQDTDNNFNDFIISTSTPQGTSSTPLETPPPPEPLPPPEPIITCATSTYAAHDNTKGAVISGVKRLPEIYANVDTILQANTTYYADWQIYVKPKAKLIIPEGVVIKFGWWRISGNYYFPAVLRIDGSLEVNGTKNNPVIFTSFRDDAHGAAINMTTSTPAPGDWGALQIESGKNETVKIQNAKFYYGGGSQGDGNGPGGAIFINLSDADIDISDTQVAQSMSGVYFRAKSNNQPEIVNGIFENNRFYGISLEKNSAIKFVGNTIKCNGLLRGTSTGGGALIKGSAEKMIIENNNFLANETGGLRYVPDKNENLTAINNYWGHSSGPFHTAANPSGQGDAISDNIIFSPWATAAFDSTE